MEYPTDCALFLDPWQEEIELIRRRLWRLNRAEELNKIDLTLTCPWSIFEDAMEAFEETLKFFEHEFRYRSDCFAPGVSTAEIVRQLENFY